MIIRVVVGLGLLTLAYYVSREFARVRAVRERLRQARADGTHTRLPESRSPSARRRP